MDEFSRIATYFAPLAAKAEGAFGLKDDAATLVPPAGEELVITQDTLVEGVHFLPAEPPMQLAQKALRVNLSDLAAKGAAPMGYFLSLSLPPRCDEAWIEAFCRGLAEDQETYGITLMGGDSTASPQTVVVTITAIGSTPRIIRRAGANAGDRLFVTGTIGDGWLGLHVAQGKLPHDAALLDRHRLPQPRVAFASAIRDHATAALDVSDGLLQDIGHLCDTSGVAITLAVDAVPLSKAAQAHVPDYEALLPLLAGGDDYEIVFTAPPAAEAALLHAAKQAGMRLSAIGSCHAGAGLSLTYKGQARELPAHRGFRHQV